MTHREWVCTNTYNPEPGTVIAPGLTDRRNKYGLQELR